MTTATKAGGAVLPVVAVIHRAPQLDSKFEERKEAQGLPIGSTALTPHAPAQATIDELRAEVERLRVVEFNSAVQFRDAVQPLREEVERLKRERWVAIQRELDALKAKQIDVDAVMRLAEEYADHASWAGYYSDDSPAKNKSITKRDAAREALRAALLGDGGTL